MSYSCRDIQEILSAQLDGETTLVEEEVASLHLVECAPCRAFSEQLEELSFAMLRESDPVPVAPLEMGSSVKLAASRPLRVLDSKLWLLLLAPTLTVNFQMATLLTENGGGSLAPLLPLGLLLALTPLLTTASMTTPWSRLRVVGALALLAPLTSLAGGLALLLLMVLVASSPRPPDKVRVAHILLGALGLIGVEALLRGQDFLRTFLAVAAQAGGDPGVWLGQAAVAAFCGWLWSLVTARRRGVGAAFAVVSVVSAGLFLSPFLTAYHTHLVRLRALPAPRSQRWWMCFGGRLHAVEARTQQWERWRKMVEATGWTPPVQATLTGQLESAPFELLPGRAVAAIPYPEGLNPQPQTMTPGRVREIIRAHQSSLDEAIEARLRPTLAGFLLFQRAPLQLSQSLFDQQERFQMLVEPGDYAIAVEMGNLESQGYGADWDRVHVDGRTDLERQGYFPNVIWERPRNLDFGQGLKDWDDNGEGKAIPGGVEVATPPFWPRGQGVSQKFRPLSVGGPAVDEVRVTVHLFEPTPYARLRLQTYSNAGDHDDLEVPAGSQAMIVGSLPVSDQISYLEIEGSFAAMGPPLRLKGFTVEGLSDGKVVESVGLPRP